MSAARLPLPLPLALAAAVALSSAASTAAFAAETESACIRAWINADNNRNGVIDSGEDGEATLLKSLPASTTEQTFAGMTRDEFLSRCTLKEVKETTPHNSPGTGQSAAKPNEFPKDLGKGDLTRGTNPISEQDARKRIESLGYKEVQDLKLGPDGIWRGTALGAATGNRQTVALDPQGDVVSK